MVISRKITITAQAAALPQGKPRLVRVTVWSAICCPAGPGSRTSSVTGCGAVVMVFSPSVQIRLAGVAGPVLGEGDDHQDHQQRHGQSRGVAELVLRERVLVDVHLQQDREERRVGKEWRARRSADE